LEQFRSPALLLRLEGDFIVAEERITERTDADGNVIETTVERNTTATPVTVNTAPASSGGGFGLIAAILLIAVAIGGYMLFANTESQNRKDDAVAKAADNVGQAAKKVGDSVEKAVDEIDGK
jgi:uncharacterized protein HemX